MATIQNGSLNRFQDVHRQKSQGTNDEPNMNHEASTNLKLRNLAHSYFAEKKDEHLMTTLFTVLNLQERTV